MMTTFLKPIVDQLNTLYKEGKIGITACTCILNSHCSNCFCNTSKCIAGFGESFQPFLNCMEYKLLYIVNYRCEG